MDREAMRMAILKQEQTFRQQVQELHRLYHVQKQLMREMQVAGSTTAPCRPHATTIDDGMIVTKPKPHILRNAAAAAAVHQQQFSFSDYKAPASATAPAEECNLELTLATGCSRVQKGKGVKSASNSDSGATALSSTSTDSELAQQFREPHDAPTVVRFQRLAGAGAGELSQQLQWMHQRLSLRMA